MAESYPNTPPMDEILASIRRIITEDAPRLPDPVPVRDAAPEAEVAEEDELLLGDEDSAEHEASIPAQAPPPPAPVPAAKPTATAEDEALLSAGAQQATQRALSALSGLLVDPSAPGNTLDGLVREMLRPMLKEWLDANLPDIVERVVAREVARLSGR